MALEERIETNDFKSALHFNGLNSRIAKFVLSRVARYILRYGSPCARINQIPAVHEKWKS